MKQKETRRKERGHIIQRYRDRIKEKGEERIESVRVRTESSGHSRKMLVK
jgi:hypothetical protein